MEEKPRLHAVPDRPNPETLAELLARAPRDGDHPALAALREELAATARTAEILRATGAMRTRSIPANDREFASKIRVIDGGRADDAGSKKSTAPLLIIDGGA